MELVQKMMTIILKANGKVTDDEDEQDEDEHDDDELIVQDNEIEVDKDFDFNIDVDYHHDVETVNPEHEAQVNDLLSP